MFDDRIDAAHQLAARLHAYRGQHPLLLAIPRGAVPMARLLADELDGELDVVLVRKLRSPRHAETAIGAVDESGWRYVAPYAAAMGADPDYIESETQAQLATIRARRQSYTPIRPPLDPAGRVVIVVDDGLATGATMLEAEVWKASAAPCASSGVKARCSIARPSAAQSSASARCAAGPPFSVRRAFFRRPQ